MGPIGPILIGAMLLGIGLALGLWLARISPFNQPRIAQISPTLLKSVPSVPSVAKTPGMGSIGPIPPVDKMSTPPISPQKKCPEIIRELLISLKQDEAGEDWEKTLGQQLRRFGKSFDCPITEVKAADINLWLRSLGVCVETRNNYRAAIVRLVNYSKAWGYLPMDWREILQVEKPKAHPKEPRILAVDQLQKLLAGTLPNMLAFTVLQAFAGLRHREVRRMKWSDIDLPRRQIYVPKAAGKGGRDRITPISDNLFGWLSLILDRLPPAQRRGPVMVELKKTSAALGRAKQKAAIPAGKNQTRNILRKSFISYRLALTKNITQTADESGNSPWIIKTNYRRPVPEDLAREWFAVIPGDEKTPQLAFDFWAERRPPARPSPAASTIVIKVKVAQDSNLRPSQKTAQPPQTNGFERNGAHERINL
jgi:integrase